MLSGQLYFDWVLYKHGWEFPIHEQTIPSSTCHIFYRLSHLLVALTEIFAYLNPDGSFSMFRWSQKPNTWYATHHTSQITSNPARAWWINRDFIYILFWNHIIEYICRVYLTNCLLSYACERSKAHNNVGDFSPLALWKDKSYKKNSFEFHYIATDKFAKYEKLIISDSQNISIIQLLIWV